ncbi:hypothetical protein LUZ63_005961 [Rhynchospora breviuscula]|uniref:DDE Tnp4 domain-containing protein n=1 Tax=Rhynchospora breviuscula TaxID=2022672 RepID=A0A9Q0CNV5_9POAL|nr:hypothetical protein LUZ63_005961 [Rhynchospora breviuscula]
MSDDDDYESKKRERNKQVALWWFNAALLCEADSKRLKRDREMSGAEYITKQLNGHSGAFYDNYRLTPANFRLLCDKLRASMWGEDDALGAIDGTHIPTFPDTDQTCKERWRNRKGGMTQNVMAAVDFDGNFLAVVSGWEGSAHDALVLRRTLEDGFTVPDGRYYLVDGGYANTHQFLSPYRGKTYHLAKFQQRRPQNQYQNAESCIITDMPSCEMLWRKHLALLRVDSEY